jgi:hypothetical protein
VGARDQNVTSAFNTVIGVNCDVMTDPNEIEALKASLRGALAAAETLAGVQDTVTALDSRGDVPPDTLETLARVTLANAVAAQALRGLVETMRQRREATA